MNGEKYLSHKPDQREYMKIASRISEDEAGRQLAHLPESYFRLFPRELLSRFADRLADLDEDRPYHYEVVDCEGGLLEVRIIAFERDSFFSLASGSLSAAGMDIVSGDIFSYTHAASGRQKNGGAAADGTGLQQNRRRGRGSAGSRRPHGRRLLDSRSEDMKLVDVFRGRVQSDVTADLLREEIPHILDEVLGTLYGLVAGGGKARGGAASPSSDGSGRRNGGRSSEERAREKVAEAVSKRLLVRRAHHAVPPLYPIDIDLEEVDESRRRLKLRSQDTPYFLYTLGTVLALHSISIEHVEIKTSTDIIEDDFLIRTSAGNPLAGKDQVDSLKLSILFSKQFTHFLWNAPDPYRALLRFETLLRELQRGGEGGESGAARSLIADPNVLRRLSRLLGASDFLWEDFIRLQYENLLPLLSEESVASELETDTESLESELRGLMEGVRGFEEKKRVLNEFKDRTTYMVDLRHILDPQADFSFLSERLSALADLVVREAFCLAWDRLKEEHGIPQTVANLPTVYAIAGLGKFGGKALGYASDIELLLLYRDAGETSGPKRISNAEFFGELVRSAASIIESKREGIYKVDLRLRPHGSGGPLAVSISRFVSYYRKEASSLEKLALVRLRTVAGDEEFSSQVERLRDVVVYEGERIDVEELVRLRRIQAEKYAGGEHPNVKYGPGGLLDLEYCLQILQVLEGRTEPKLRTPYLHEVFGMLSERGSLDAESGSILEGAYFFLRRLINALRMLRGNALDLYLPARSSPEFLHLARRMGYQEESGVSAEEQLFVDYRKYSAVVRNFVQNSLGAHAVPWGGAETIADILLAEHPGDEEVERVFSKGGFGEWHRGFLDFRTLMRGWSDRSRFIELALLAWDYLVTSPEPDMALNNWERFVGELDDTETHFHRIYRQPKRLEILLRILSASQFLADLLIQHPDFFDEVTDPGRIHGTRGYGELYEELSAIRRSDPHSVESWRRELRMFRHRHLLRVGSRDICYGASLKEIFSELSSLAEAVLQAALDYRLEQFHPEGGDTAEAGSPNGVAAESVCILALGKLGGGELNYSSDIDLVILYEPGQENAKGSGDFDQIRKVVRAIRADIADPTEEGRAYRVDFRLRPYGGSGDLVSTPRQLEEYYRRAAGLWEYQALLKARAVAGNRSLGERVVKRIRDRQLPGLSAEEIIHSVREARRASEWPAREMKRIDVKESPGGLRDIEFLVQGLQLIHAAKRPEIVCGATLDAIDLLREYGYLLGETAERLTVAYRFLRRVEHFLQLLEDRQEHSLPGNSRAIEALSRRMRWTRICSGDFSARLRETMEGVRSSFRGILEEEENKATST